MIFELIIFAIIVGVIVGVWGLVNDRDFRNIWVLPALVIFWLVIGTLLS